ncbi:MAG: hypothetical protein Q4P71_04760 [Actinomycetaceae bacterium]|nr:hypothetical protein [Actinomycetaceae bacterium]
MSGHEAAGSRIQSADDRRGASHGLGRIVIGLFWIAAALFLFTSVSDYMHFPTEPIGPRLVSVLAAVGYVVGAIALTHNGRRMRMIGWTAVGFELAGAFITGMVGIGVDDIGAIRSVWGNFGAQYLYVPLILPIIGLGWLWWSNPRRIVEISEILDR